MARDWSGEIETLIDRMTGYYLDADVAATVAEVFRAGLLAGRYAGCSDEESFAALATRDAQSVNGDLHLTVVPSIHPVRAGPGDVVAERGHTQLEADLAGGGFSRVDRLPGNVGLVEMSRFFDTALAGRQAVAAMHLVASADALIIDLRGCPGGEPSMVCLVAGYLFDAQTQLDSLYFPAEQRTEQLWTPAYIEPPAFGATKPLYVLVGGGTYSAAEALAYDLQQYGRGVVIGARTAGAANFDYRYRVSEHLMFSVPSGYPVNPVSGTHWERTGVTPDVAVPVEDAEREAYRRALEHVRSLGGQAERRSTIRQAEAALGG